MWDELVPVGHDRRNVVVQLAAQGPAECLGDSPMLLLAESYDARLAHALGYLFEPVAENDDGGVQPTYDLSVPENVTYVAGGFVSHNTIGLMMDCDTTGIEPDLALVKFKKLVGGGSMQIVNQTVPRALAKLGYQPSRSRRSSSTSASTATSSTRRACAASTTRCSTARWASGRSPRWGTCG